MRNTFLEIEYELPFKSTEFRQKWAEWLQYRKQELKKPPYKSNGLTRAFNRLKRFSCENETKAIFLIDEAMDREWKGFFPVKDSSTRANNNLRSTTIIQPAKPFGKF